MDNYNELTEVRVESKNQSRQFKLILRNLGVIITLNPDYMEKSEEGYPILRWENYVRNYHPEYLQPVTELIASNKRALDSHLMPLMQSR